jgi:hypothetical protein
MFENPLHASYTNTQQLPPSTGTYCNFLLIIISYSLLIFSILIAFVLIIIILFRVAYQFDQASHLKLKPLDFDVGPQYQNLAPPLPQQAWTQVYENTNQPLVLQQQPSIQHSSSMTRHLATQLPLQHSTIAPTNAPLQPTQSVQPAPYEYNNINQAPLPQAS